ncbi:MAG TPA: 2'-5' RNA ligase family protein, partial [Pyrinomonadaceae bacterium]
MPVHKAPIEKPFKLPAPTFPNQILPEKTASVPPTQYTKRQIKPGEQYYDFEQTGKTTDGLNYLGMASGRHRFKNADDDELELDEATKQLKPLGTTKRAKDAEGNEYLLSEDQSNLQIGETRRTKATGEKFIFSPDGKIHEENPKIVLGEGDAQLTQSDDQTGVAAGKVRVSSKDGKSFLAAKGEDNQYSLAEEVEKPEATDEDYKIWLNYKNKFEKANLADSPETRAKFDADLNKADAENFGSDAAAKSYSLGQNLKPAHATQPQTVQPELAQTEQTLNEIQPQQENAPTTQPENKNQQPRNLDVKVTVRRNQSVKSAIEEATRSRLSEFGLEAQDVDEAMRKNRLLTSDGSDINDSGLEEAVKSKGYLEHTIGAGLINDAINAKAVREKKEVFESRIKSGELKGLDIYRAMKTEGFISEEEMNRLIDEENRAQSRLKGELTEEYKNTDIAPTPNQAVALTGLNTNPLGLGNLLGTGSGLFAPRPRTDEEIQTDALKKFNQIIGQSGGFAKTYYDRQEDERAEQEKLEKEYISGGGYNVPLQAIKSFSKAIPKAVGGILETVDIIGEASGLNLTGSVFFGQGLYDSSPAYKRNAFEFSQAVNRYIEKDLPDDPRLKDNLLLTTLPDTLGQLSVQMLAGFATGGTAAPTLIGMSQGASEQYKEAVKHGASPNQRLFAALVGGIAAAPDALLFNKWFKGTSVLNRNNFVSRFANSVYQKLVGQGIAEAEAKELAKEVGESWIKRWAKEGVEFGKNALPDSVFEAVQEPLESKVNDLTAFLTYDRTPERLGKLTTVTKENLVEALAGFSGGFAGAGVSTAINKMNSPELEKVGDSLKQLLGENKISAEVYAEAEKAIEERKANPEPLTEPVSQNEVVKESVNEAAPEKSQSVIGQTVEVKGRGRGKIEKEINEKTVAVALENGSVVQARKKNLSFIEDGAKPENVKSSENTDSDKQETEKPAHEFSSTQVDLPEDISKEVLSVSENLVKTEDLSEDGREDTPHITVKYGIHAQTPRNIRKILENEKPFEAKLGKVSVFDTNPDFDVVKVDVESPELHRLNETVADNTKTTDTHPEYKPHLTLAYVKKGEGQKYVGNTDLEGKEISFDSITFSDKNRNKISIPLGGKNSETTESGAPDLKANIFTTQRGEKIHLEDVQDFVIKRGTVGLSEIQRNFKISYSEARDIADKIKQTLGENVIKQPSNKEKEIEQKTVVLTPAEEKESAINKPAPVKRKTRGFSDLREELNLPTRKGEVETVGASGVLKQVASQQTSGFYSQLEKTIADKMPNK